MLWGYHAGMQTTTLLRPAIISRLANDSSRLGLEAGREGSATPGHDDDRLRLSAYVLMALVALFAGYVLGLLGGEPSNRSRIDWPQAPTNPRSYNP